MSSPLLRRAVLTPRRPIRHLRGIRHAQRCVVHSLSKSSLISDFVGIQEHMSAEFKALGESGCVAALDVKYYEEFQ